MKRLLAVLIILFMSSLAYSADDFFPATGLTGGTTGKLDAIDVTNDDIDDGEKAFALSSTLLYPFHYNSGSGAAESSPEVIAPDKDAGGAYAGNGRWILIGYYGAIFQASNGTSINEFSTDGTMAGNSDDAVPTEKAVVTYTANQIATLFGTGFVTRSKFTYKDADEIYISSGRYHHSGTADQLVYWNSQITFEAEAAGSNALSDDFGTSEWHYVYIDDSAVVTLGTNLLTASEFLNDTTGPAWSEAKHGWYNGNDRCIAAFYVDGAGAIDEFFHAGDFISYADRITDLNGSDIDTTWTDVTLTIPGFATSAQCTFRSEYVDGSSTLFYRTNGQTGSDGIMVGYSSADNPRGISMSQVVTDTSQKIEVKHSASNGNSVDVWTNGWYFPIGM